MEGDDGLSTVQCLRGRLLAERQASRVAKENAKLLETKVCYALSNSSIVIKVSIHCSFPHLTSV